MPDISLLEASQRYGVNERVIRRWIKAGWLEDRKIMVRGRLQYILDSTALETLLASRNVGHVRSISDQPDDARIANLEQRVTDLEALVYALQEARARAEHPSGPPTPPQRKTAPEREKQPSQKKYKPVPPDLPPGTVSMQEFSDTYGVPYGTMREQVITGKIEVEQRTNPVKPNETLKFVTPAQASAILAFWRSIGKIREPGG